MRAGWDAICRTPFVYHLCVRVTPDGRWSVRDQLSVETYHNTCSGFTFTVDFREYNPSLHHCCQDLQLNHVTTRRRSMVVKDKMTAERDRQGDLFCSTITLRSSYVTWTNRQNNTRMPRSSIAWYWKLLCCLIKVMDCNEFINRKCL